MHTSRVQRVSALNDTEGLILVRRLYIRCIQLSETTSRVYIYIDIVSQFDPLPAVEISDTRRSLVLTKKPQGRTNSFIKYLMSQLHNNSAQRHIGKCICATSNLFLFFLRHIYTDDFSALRRIRYLSRMQSIRLRLHNSRAHVTDQLRFSGRLCRDVSVITLEISTLRLNHHLHLGYRS